MDAKWKNSLQEYCQKRKIHLPNYRVKNLSGPPHILKFQVEVEVEGHWYVGEDQCSSKKEAEQSAAKKAWDALLSRSVSTIAQSSIVPTSEEHSELPPSYDEAVRTNPMTNSSNEHTDIKQFIATKVAAFGGRIRKISPPDSHGRYKYEINGSYRYCENVKQHHRKNQIYFIVDPIKRTYLQRCHDPECFGFQSPLKSIDNEQRTLPNSEENDSMDECSRCSKALMMDIKLHANVVAGVFAEGVSILVISAMVQTIVNDASTRVSIVMIHNFKYFSYYNLDEVFLKICY